MRSSGIHGSDEVLFQHCCDDVFPGEWLGHFQAAVHGWAPRSQGLQLQVQTLYCRGGWSCGSQWRRTNCLDCWYLQSITWPVGLCSGDRARKVMSFSMPFQCCTEVRRGYWSLDRVYGLLDRGGDLYLYKTSRCSSYWGVTFLSLLWKAFVRMYPNLLFTNHIVLLVLLNWTPLDLPFRRRCRQSLGSSSI